MLGKSKEFCDEDLLALINSVTGENQYDLESISSASQKVINEAIDTNFMKELLESAVEERELARINSVGMKHAGDWLNAVPVKAPLRIHNISKVSSGYASLLFKRFMQGMW